MQERYLKILRAMVAHDENRFCFDCHQRGPTYVNITVGSFVCTSCGGALRKYNHRIKSISMSNFSQSEMEFLRKRGNKACRKIYLALSDDQGFAEKELGDAARDEHLRQKYQIQKWYREPTMDQDTEAIRENQQILDRLEQSESSQKSARNPPMNAAAGLLLPSRQTSSSSNCSSTTSTLSISQAAPICTNGLHARPLPLSPPPSDPFSGVPLESSRLQAHALKSSTAADPFAVFSTSSTSMATGTTDNFFADFSSNAAAPSSNPNVTVTKPPNESVFNAAFNVWPSAGLESKQSGSDFTTVSQSAATGDKYAALAELDGLFKNAGASSAPAHPEPTNLFRFPGPTPIATSSVFPINTFGPTQISQQPQNPFIAPVVNIPSIPRQYSASNPFTSPIPSREQPLGPSFTTIPVSAPPPSTAPPTKNPFFSEQQLCAPWPNNKPNPFSSIEMPGVSNGKSRFQCASQSSGAFSLSDSLSTNGIFPPKSEESCPNPSSVYDHPFSDFAAFRR